MSTKYTPAPWAVWSMGRNLTVTATGNESKKHPNEGMHIATIHLPESKTHYELFNANAQIIASAPEAIEVLQLARKELHACQAVIHLHGGFDPAYVNDAQKALKIIDAVIAKALGETK